MGKGKGKIMKRKISWILAGLLLMGCQPKEKKVIPPESGQVGKMCTYVVSFDDDMYNISIYYETMGEYIIENEEDFNIIDEISLKYSKTGKGDVNKYSISKERVLSECGMNDPKSVSTVVNISKDDAWFLTEELKAHKFYFRVEKEGQMFDVKMPNTVYFRTSDQMNDVVYSKEFSKYLIFNEKSIGIDVSILGGSL